MYLAHRPIIVPFSVLLIIPADSILIPVINSTLRCAYRICDTWKLSGTELVALINLFLYKKSVVSSVSGFIPLADTINFLCPQLLFHGLQHTDYSLLGFHFPENEKKKRKNRKSTTKPPAPYIRCIPIILHSPHQHLYLSIFPSTHLHPLQWPVLFNPCSTLTQSTYHASEDER
jgi:hypothetical protein